MDGSKQQRKSLQYEAKYCEQQQTAKHGPGKSAGEIWPVASFCSDDEQTESEHGRMYPIKKRSTADLVLEEVRRIAKERARGLTLDSNITELGFHMTSGCQRAHGRPMSKRSPITTSASA